MGVGIQKPGRRAKATFVQVGFVALVVIGVALAFAFTQGQATGASATAPQTTQQMTLIGASTIHSTPRGSGAVANPETDDRDDEGDGPGIKPGLGPDVVVRPFATASSSSSKMPRHRTNLPIPSKLAAGRASAAARSNTSGSTFPPPEPNVPPSFVVGFQTPGFAGFNGLSHIDQREANNGNQFSLEPPDQGLCAGNGFVIETVNDVIQVYNTRGTVLVGVEDMNSFFGLATQINRTTGVTGPFLSDPRCFYDAQTQRWFVTELMEDDGTNTGASGRNFNLIAVSQTADPTQAFTVFKYDVTDDGLNGTPSHAGCPCFGDQPLFGTDKFGVYQATNEFGEFFNGAQLYAISKAQLVAAANGGPLPAVIAIDASQQLVPFGGLSYSIQPATAPGQDDWDHDQGGSAHGGVEYFLSALQFVDTFDNRIAVWALTNTKSLNSSSPNLTLAFDVLNCETYGQPNPASQKLGDIPLGASFGEGLETLNTNDDRMNQVVFSQGVLFSGVNSLLKVGGAEQQGIAWFGVQPSFKGSTLTGRIVRQGYVAVKGNDVLFPSLGINDDGNGVIAYTLAGNGFFPSAAYTDVFAGFALPIVHIAGAGQDSDDGFTGYVAEGGDGTARWGDYSAAVADGDRIWFASEYIPNKCTTNALPCRTTLANWGTFFATVRPFGF